jgi:hypothetical protein
MGMILVDVEKIFDSVRKLIQGGCNIFLARIIHFFFSGLTFQDSVGKLNRR